jgi:uncharacterized protein YqjF (DUF2071 family)
MARAYAVLAGSLTGRTPRHDRGVHTAVAPEGVARPVMRHRWELLTFLHWSFEPPQVQRLLPDWLEVETFEDRAWVGLVPFFMRVSTAGGRNVPWASNFCETNVRTYVRDRTGRSGIWFFSLDAARLGAVVVARATYRLPYFWSAMRLEVDGDEVRYDCRRRWPGPRGARSSARITLGSDYHDAELVEFDHFLTARWVLFSAAGARHRHARAWHEPWALRRAEAHDVHDELLPAAGLPAPTDVPLVHYSRGVDVKIGRPERARPLLP